MASVATISEDKKQPVALSLRHFTGWGKVGAQPAYAQYRFPPVPGVTTFTAKYRLDYRYGTELWGGNPCDAAKTNATYKCKMCVEDDWDYDAKPGFYVLWPG